MKSPTAVVPDSGHCPTRSPLGQFVVIVILLGCAFSVVGADSVRKVEYGGRPEFRELAEQARQIGNELYPRVLALLSDGKTEMPRRFDIVIKRTLSSGEIGALGFVRGHKGTVVYLNGGALSYQPAALKGLLVHEMAHVAQRYSFWSPRSWTEGMADYVRWKLCPKGGEGDSKETNCPVCSNMTWHYSQGYDCAAAFLFYLEATYGSNVVGELNARLRHHSYSDAFFKTVTGETVDQLWEDFKRTPRYTQSAAEMTRELAKLGVREGADPINQIRQQRGGELTLKACNFLMGLMDKHELPGFSHGESTAGLVIHIAGIGDAESAAFPASRTFRGFAGASNVFNYTVVRDSRFTEWRLQRAWRTDEDGNLVEEYRIR